MDKQIKDSLNKISKKLDEINEKAKKEGEIAHSISQSVKNLIIHTNKTRFKLEDIEKDLQNFITDFD